MKKNDLESTSVSVKELRDQINFMEKEMDRCLTDTNNFLQKSFVKTLGELTLVNKNSARAIVLLYNSQKPSKKNIKKSLERLKIYAPKSFLETSKYLGTSYLYLEDCFLLYNNQKSKITENIKWQSAPMHEFFTIYDEYNFLKSLEDDTTLEIAPKATYESFVDAMAKYRDLTDQIVFFDDKNHLLREYQNRSLEKYDLSKVDWEHKNISGIDISSNVSNLSIDFDVLEKTLENASVRGYRLDHFCFYDWNLKEADLRDTGASIDLASCKYTLPEKVNHGTLFDEENKFFMGQKSLSLQQVQDLGVKIYKK